MAWEVDCSFTACGAVKAAAEHCKMRGRMAVFRQVNEMAFSQVGAGIPRQLGYHALERQVLDQSGVLFACQASPGKYCIAERLRV